MNQENTHETPDWEVAYIGPILFADYSPNPHPITMWTPAKLFPLQSFFLRIVNTSR